MSAKQQQDPPPIGSLVTVKYLGLSETVCIIVYDMYAVLCICENYVLPSSSPRKRIKTAPNSTSSTSSATSHTCATITAPSGSSSSGGSTSSGVQRVGIKDEVQAASDLPAAPSAIPTNTKRSSTKKSRASKGDTTLAATPAPVKRTSKKKQQQQEQEANISSNTTTTTTATITNKTSANNADKNATSNNADKNASSITSGVIDLTEEEEALV